MSFIETAQPPPEEAAGIRALHVDGRPDFVHPTTARLERESDRLDDVTEWRDGW